MKTLVKLLLLTVVFCYSNTAITAQEDKVQYYHVMDYMKVKPGMNADYLKVEKVWKKIHESNIKSGKYVGWELTELQTSIGASAEYGYVTRTTFKGDKQLADHMEEFSMPKDLEKILSPDEMKILEMTSKTRTFVKSETWVSEQNVSDEKHTDSDAKIHVFNYFDFPEGGSRSAHMEVETNVWKPVHEERVKTDKMEAWVLAKMIFPFGSDQPYHDGTVDIYKNMEQYLASSFSKELFEKVHPGKDAEKLFDQTDAACELIKGEVRMVIDKVTVGDVVAANEK